jgi:hypothetical protein
MIKIPLGRWTFDSGNACHATLELTEPNGLSISFAWKSPLTEADKDQYMSAVLRDVVRVALEGVERLAALHLVLLRFESEGRIARVGSRDGDTLWEALPEKERTANRALQNWSLNALWSKLQGFATSNWSRLL